MRLLDAAGTVVASHDRPLLPNDRFGLFVPPQAVPGSYTLAAVLYDPATANVVASPDGTEMLRLATIEIVR